ncbi:MAG TPA: tetratricopeptide repeat protein [Vicinamibacterales bacterium]|nr:tetratricopeptide repeat protein [Vicinamibacterales bacterium]
MRTHLFRGILALALVVAVSAPALAQSVVRGKVSDAQGKPVPDASVVFEAVDANRKTQTKTDKNGEFLQVGLQSGAYKVTAAKDKIGTQTLNQTVRQGPNNPLNFTISASSAAGAASPADKAEAAAIQASAGAAVEAMKAGRHDEAIAKFNEVIAKVPNCSDCYYNLGVAYVAKQQYTEAEASFKKVLELKPDSGDAYTGLANIYNTQKKFDLAAEASTKASQFASAGGAAGAGAEASYNQGVILFNAGKFAEARGQFETASKADPTMAMAHYQLGMTSLNLGQIPEAVAALEAYLKTDPNGPKAAEVKTALPALQGMLKK